MPANVNFREWKHFFITGKTKGVYLALLAFAVFAILILYNRENLFFFTVIQVGSFASFGVLVDLISHLFNDRYQSGIPFDQWVRRFKSGRTHDIYGIIVQIVASAIDLVEFHLAFVLWILLLPEAYMIVKARFYH
ncbi:MAG: hypothetical protein ACYDCP_03075 [Thermoplasmataceae archaeon]|nr:hypothetical protein [Candidatus Thermoplasmatota archaeon]